VSADRALFDESRESILARKYEASTERSLFRTLREFREVEAAALKEEEVADLIEVNRDTKETCEDLGSSLPGAGASSPATPPTDPPAASLAISEPPGGPMRRDSGHRRGRQGPG